MTDAVAIAIITGAVTTVGSIITAVVSVRNGRKADKLAVKADQIHADTNGNLGKVTKELESARKDVADLNRLVAALATDKK